jgi:hypothetical protein
MIATIDRKCQESARKGLKTRALMFCLEELLARGEKCGVQNV